MDAPSDHTTVSLLNIIIQGQNDSLFFLSPSLHHVLTPCYPSFSLFQTCSIWFSAVHQQNLVLFLSWSKKKIKKKWRRVVKWSKAVTQTDRVKLKDGGVWTVLFWMLQALKIFALLIWVMAASLKGSVAFLTSRWSHASRPPARPKFARRCCFQFRRNFEVDPSACAKALVRPLSCYGDGCAAGVRELWKGSKHRTAENSSASPPPPSAATSKRSELIWPEISSNRQEQKDPVQGKLTVGVV